MSLDTLRDGLTTSIAITLAGQVGTGKTAQMERVFNLCIITESGERIYPFRPLMFMSVGGDRSSAGGTASAMLTHPDCHHVTADTVDDCIRVLRDEFKSRTFKAVAVDSFSSFRSMAVSEVRQRAVVESDGGKSLRGQAKKNVVHNDQQLHGLANGDVRDFISTFFTLGGDRPLLRLASIHTQDQYKPKRSLNDPDMYVGQKPAASFTQWTQGIYPASNIIWHLHRELPQPRRGLTSAQVSEMYQRGELAPRYYAYTVPMDWPTLGELRHVKRQTDGHMAAFDLAPPEWENPNLGEILSHYLVGAHGLTEDDLARITITTDPQP